jgi:hypothetical protein
LARLTELARDRIRDRQAVRENAAALESIRAALAEADLDPAVNPGVRYFASADRALAALPDSIELQRADAEFIAHDPELAGRDSLARRGAARAADFVGRPPPAATGSPLDWYAWSLASRSR